MKLNRILGLLAFAPLPMLMAQVAPRAVLTGANVRAEAIWNTGRLQERFLARSGRTWLELAVSAGKTVGSLTITDLAGSLKAGAVTSLSSDQNALVEELTVGDLRIRRTLSLTDDDHWLKVTTRLENGSPTALHSFSDQMQAKMQADWSYSPAVGGFNPDAEYKAPLILVQADRRAFGIVPDVSVLSRDLLKRCNHVLDLDAPTSMLSVGFIPARLAYHSVFREDLDRLWNALEPVENSYYLFLSASAPPREAFRDAVRFHWSHLANQELPIAASAQAGTDVNYKQFRLWDEWRREIWDEESPKRWLSFRIADGAVGGAVRMLRWGGPKPSVYLGAWFNSLRTAFGMALYARRANKPDLMNLARQTLELALKAPGTAGAFKCIAVPKGETGEIAWAAGDGSGASVEKGFLGFDMSWTGYWLLRWHGAGLSGDAAILDRVSRLAKFFISRQLSDGMLPTRFDEEGDVQLVPSRTVRAETAPVVLFLLELYKAQPNSEYLLAARKGLQFLEREVILERKWYDFETFWSCSPRLIALDERTRQWPANNLALIHAVAAYLAAHQVTKETRYLDKGQALLDYLLLYQQSWTNPALEGLSGGAMLLGGFTTQNSDAEWSDARQSLAGNVLIDYYRATGKAEYLERGVEALRSQFPVSPSENWAHAGYGGKAGVSSFHWGTGSGMAGIEIDDEYLKDAVFDVAAKRGVGVNGLNLTAAAVENRQIQFHLDSPFSWSRNPVVAFRNVEPERTYEVSVNGNVIGAYPAKALEAGLNVPLAWISAATAAPR